MIKKCKRNYDNLIKVSIVLGIYTKFTQKSNKFIDK